MDARFYAKGDAVDLAAQLIAILRSPELQRQMAEHNYAAGVDMTMTNVVRNYLRWFELHKCKRRLERFALPSRAPRVLTTDLVTRVESSVNGLLSGPPTEGVDRTECGLRRNPESLCLDVQDVSGPHAWSDCEQRTNHANDNMNQTAHVPDVNC